MNSLNTKFARGHGHVVRKHMAKALIGRAVDLLVECAVRSAQCQVPGAPETSHPAPRTTTIVHGVVTDVMTEAGTPKLIVGGTRYDLSQILTTMPASLDLQLQTLH